MSLQVRKKKSKKGISIIIGYVLLVTFAVVMGILVFKWMRTYVPQEDPSCPDGSTLFIASQNYDCDSHTLTLKMVNNGNFDLGGYFIYATNSSNKPATIQLARSNMDIRSNITDVAVKFGNPIDKNSLRPQESEIEIYNLTAITQVYGQIAAIEIIPLRWQTQNRKMALISCDTSKIREITACYMACVPAGDTITCAGIDCGTKINNCGEQVDCGDCTDPEQCNILGECVNPSSCTDTCDDAECGFVCGDDCNKDCPDLNNANEVCSFNLCVIGICDDGYGNCDGNDANGCETVLGTEENCGECGDDCGAETCVSGMCTTGSSTCNGVWSLPENVVCDGGTFCQTDCTCETGTSPLGNGACAPAGVASCQSYCVWLGTYGGGESYTSGACRQNPAQCTNYCSGGDIQTGGNSWCVSPTINCCCCP